MTNNLDFKTVPGHRKHNNRLIPFVLFVLFVVSVPVRGAELAARHWHTSDSTVELRDGDTVIWRFNHAATSNTPFFHPVATADGKVLTSNQPPDHPWHHGVWFCWKFVNGVNYWEPVGDTGRPEGLTQWSDVDVTTRDDDSARISMALSYRPASDDTVVLVEQRQIEISSPDEDGSYRMDWTSRFKAGAQKVTLDRVPPKIQSWGGYAGLSVRFALDLSDRAAATAEGNAEFNKGDRHRSRSAAMDYNGVVDGREIGLAFLDHPSNPRHPTPWYAIRGPVMSYINAALVANDPMDLDPEQQMTLRYRLIVHPGRWDAERLQAAHARYTQQQDVDSQE